MMQQEQTQVRDEPIAEAVIAEAARVVEIEQPGALRRAWRGWLRFAEILGVIQMTIILSLVYWTLVMITAVFLKLFADPLALRRSHRNLWVRRQDAPDVLESMRRQF
ncbi:MAG: hypothetical protein IIC22_08255, partial [Chloroflexi bacterium]|nr:hypothetical protein [Chloroflexota bacterium]